MSNLGGKSYWKSDTSEPLKKITIGQLMEDSASKFADRVAISMYGGEKLTYDAVDKQVKLIQHLLLQ